MKVWVLDVVGYDARGGNASVFSTLEKAKASRPGVEWKFASRVGWRDEWHEPLPYPGSTADIEIIYAVEVDA